MGRKPVTSDDEDVSVYIQPIRKRFNRILQSDNPKLKRKAQNRAAQRAFRERKENHVRILEDRVKELETLNLEKNTALAVENEQLKDMITRLQNENAALLGSSSSFDSPLSNNLATSDTKRPTKLIRSSNEPAYFSSSASSNSTPETQHQPISIDDILGLDTSVLPSHALLDHSELLGFNNDYTDQLNDMLSQHRLTFATNPSEFDFFYPLSNDVLDTASIQLPKDDEGDKYINSITKVWDKISEHPRFDEVDMDLLCDEMKKKAVCNDADHDKEFELVLNEHYPIE